MAAARERFGRLDGALISVGESPPGTVAGTTDEAWRSRSWPSPTGCSRGLAGVVKTLAGELGPTGIRVNGILPVRIATDRVRELDALRGDPDEVRARLSEHIPLRRYGEPEEFGRGRRIRAVPRRVLHHRRDDPG